MERSQRLQLLNALRSLSAGQHGIVTSEQLRVAGSGVAVGRRLAARLVDEGWLHPLLGGAFSVGAPPSDWQVAVAAVMLSAPDSALSHRSAARCHRIADLVPQAIPEISLPNHRHCRLQGVIVHRVARLDAADVILYQGVRATSPERTLVDLANGMDIGLLERIVDEGAVAHLWTPRSILAAVERNASRSGTVALRRILTSRVDLPVGESALEARAIKVLASCAPFETQYQLSIGNRLVILDIAWPDLRVAAECDGWTVRNRSRSKFDADRRRDNLLTHHGWSVVHLTTAMSDDEMRAVVFRQLLKAASASAS